jgi:ubiquinone/menaquinone biosynthesis C-methylase UbiE
MNLWWRLVKFGFRLLYNEMAFTYDTVSKVVSFGSWRCWQRSALKHLNAATGARVLELAHGTGDLQLDLHQAGYQMTGYDLSPYMGRITRRKLKQHHLPVRLSRGMAQNLPFVDEAFDAIVCTFPTSFVFESATLTEVKRVLRPGGRFVIVISGVFTSGGAGTTLLDWLYKITGQQNTEQPAPEAERILRFFSDHGFSATLQRESCPHSYAVLIVAEV